MTSSPLKNDARKQMTSTASKRHLVVSNARRLPEFRQRPKAEERQGVTRVA